MPLTRPCPPEARPLVSFLRRGTKRPRGLPRSIQSPATRRWQPPNLLRWFRGVESVCPVGFHPLVTETRDPDDPDKVYAFLNAAFPARLDVDEGLREPAFTASCDAFFAFIGWWDAQTDAEAAVTAVWGPR